MFVSVQVHVDQSRPPVLGSHKDDVQTICFPCSGVSSPIVGMTTAEMVELHKVIGAHLQQLGAIPAEPPALEVVR